MQNYSTDLNAIQFCGNIKIYLVNLIWFRIGSDEAQIEILFV
jgi:hypothetical protein